MQHHDDGDNGGLPRPCSIPREVLLKARQMDKFSDNLALAAPGTHRPTTVSELLHKLRLTDAPEDDKIAAVRDWLRDHDPSPLMVFDLRRKGLESLMIGIGGTTSG